MQRNHFTLQTYHVMAPCLSASASALPYSTHNCASLAHCKLKTKWITFSLEKAGRSCLKILVCMLGRRTHTHIHTHTHTCHTLNTRYLAFMQAFSMSYSFLLQGCLCRECFSNITSTGLYILSRNTNHTYTCIWHTEIPAPTYTWLACLNVYKYMYTYIYIHKQKTRPAPHDNMISSIHGPSLRFKLRDFNTSMDS